MGDEVKTRLTLEAKGMGFESTAQSVEALAFAEQKLVEANQRLAQARESGTVSDVAKAIGEIEQLNFVVGELKGPQDAVAASERDWIGTLRQVSPALGQFVDQAVKAGKVITALGSSKSSLVKIGAAAVPVLLAVASAARAIADEFLRATQAIRDQAKALDELARQQRDQQQTIETLRDASKLGPFSAEQSQAALQTFERIREQFPFIDEAALKRAVAFTGGAAGQRGGGAFDVQQIAQTARLIETGRLELTEKLGPASMEARIQRRLGLFGPELDQQFAREAEQRAEQRSRVAGEAASSGGPTLNLREVIERRAPEGANIDRLVELAQKLEDLEGVRGTRRLLEMAESGESPSLHVLRRAGQAAGLLGIDAGALDPRMTATQADLATLLQVFQEIANEIRKGNERPRVVNLQNSKFVGPSAEAQRRASVNGESFAARGERN